MEHRQLVALVPMLREYIHNCKMKIARSDHAACFHVRNIKGGKACYMQV